MIDRYGRTAGGHVQEPAIDALPGHQTGHGQVVPSGQGANPLKAHTSLHKSFMNITIFGSGYVGLVTAAC
ncbi:MAG: hypothetical protein ACHQIO_06225, partial [Nevskiales bacterium]